MTDNLPEPLEGCIHFRCWNCGETRVNLPREPTDPASSVVVESICGLCENQGDKDPPMYFYDRQGREVT